MHKSFWAVAGFMLAGCLFLFSPAVNAATCPLPPPTNLRVTTSGNTATLSWDAVAGATQYGVRIDSTANYWKDDCNALQPGDSCKTVSTLSHSFTFDTTKSYNLWVHAQNATSCGAKVATIGLNYPSIIPVGGYVKSTTGTPIAGAPKTLPTA